MTSDALAVVRCLFDTVWRLFTSWHIPGTSTTPAAFMLFALFMCLSLRVMKGLVPGLAARDFDEGGESE